MENRIRIVSGNYTRPTAVKLKEYILENSSLVNVKLIKKNIEESNYIYNEEKDFLINWGCSEENKFTVNPDINDYKRVKLTSNKLAFFKLLDVLGYKDNIPEYTDNLREIIHRNEDDLIVYRETVAGHGGKGITITKTDGEIVYSDRFNTGENLYYLLDYEWLEDTFKFKTLYFKAKREYRIYFYNSSALGYDYMISSKKLCTGECRPEEPNFYVRNYDNGFIFQRNLEEGEEESLNHVIEKLVEITKKIGSNIIAYDIRVKENGDWVILEGNSAPSLTGESLKFYGDLLLDDITCKLL